MECRRCWPAPRDVRAPWRTARRWPSDRSRRRSPYGAQHLEIRSGAAAAIENARRAARRRWRARARASCIAGSHETRSAIAPLGRSAQVVDPRTKVCDRHATIRPHMRFRGLAEATIVVTRGRRPRVRLHLSLHHQLQQRRPARHQRRPLEHLGGVVGGARADDGSACSLFRANIFYPHDNALAFSEGNFVGGAIGVPVWLLTKNPYADPQLRLPRRVRAVVRRDVLPGALPDRRPARGGARRHACSRTVRSRSCGRRTSSCC